MMLEKEQNQCRGCTTDTYLSMVTETVDQMDPLREIWMKGKIQGNKCGWIQTCFHTYFIIVKVDILTFQWSDKWGRLKEMEAHRMKRESYIASIVKTSRNVT